MANDYQPIRDCLFGIATEGATPGTYAGPFDASECDLQLYGDLPTWSVNANTHKVNPVGADGTTGIPLPGHTVGTMSFKTMWKGAGVAATLETEPSYAKALKMCGMQGGTAVSLATTGSPSTTFISGETITGGTSAETAKVVYHDSTNNLLIVHTASGAFSNSETLTGGVSGGTIDTAADVDQTTYGYVMWPDGSSGVYSCGWISGIYTGTKSTGFSLTGCRGSWGLDFAGIGAPGMLSFNVNGAPHADSMEEYAAAISPTYDTGTPVGFKGANFTVGGLAKTALKLNAFNIDSGGNTVMPTNANDDYYGVDYALHDGNRDFTGGFDPAVIE